MKIKVFCNNLWNKFTKRNQQGRLAIFDNVVFYVVVSLVLEFVIEILSNRSFFKAFEFLRINPLAFVFNAAIIFATYTVCFLIPKRVFTFAFISIIWFGLGMTNFILQFKRVTPLTVVDFGLIPSVFKIFSVYLNVTEIILIVLALLAVVVGLVIAAIKLKSHKIELIKGLLSLLLSALVIVLLFNIGLMTSTLSNNFDNINIAYNQYGFPYCFIVGAFDRGIDKPGSYNEEAIKSILDTIESKKDTTPAKKPNIVFIQLESFFDVNYLNKLEYSSNPLPVFTELKQNSISGFLTVPVIGMGTINTEFEVITGMNLDYFGAGEYPYKTVLKDTTCESTAFNLMELGYNTHAIHNYEGSFYERHEVYPYLGFQTFTSLEYMNGFEYNASGKWIDDSILTSEIIAALDSTVSSDYVMAVSVQGHGKYPPDALPDDYEEPIEVSYKEGYERNDLEALSYFVNQMKEMDDFLGELIEAINEYDEDTVVVLYGDHLPTLGLTEDDLTDGTLFTTEYVVFSNYGVENEIETFGNLFTYQLSAKVLGLVNVSNGILTKLHQNYMSADEYSDWLYNLCYDMLYGKRYVYDGNYEYYRKTEMKMGIRDIAVNSWNYDGQTLYLHGENFTPFSKIVINGKIYDDTVFVSENEICVSTSKSALETISVVQYSDTDIVLGRIDGIEKIGD